jgi:hypothetical protein
MPPYIPGIPLVDRGADSPEFLLGGRPSTTRAIIDATWTTAVVDQKVSSVASRCQKSMQRFDQNLKEASPVTVVARLTDVSEAREGDRK